MWWLGMPQNSPCLEVSHQRKVGPCHPPGMVFDPDRGSNGACPGLDLHAMAFLASAWGLQTAGIPRRLQELKTPEVAFGYLWGWRSKTWSCPLQSNFVRRPSALAAMWSIERSPRQ